MSTRTTSSFVAYKAKKRNLHVVDNHDRGFDDWECNIHLKISWKVVVESVTQSLGIRQRSRPAFRLGPFTAKSTAYVHPCSRQHLH